MYIKVRLKLEDGQYSLDKLIYYQESKPLEWDEIAFDSKNSINEIHISFGQYYTTRRRSKSYWIFNTYNPLCLTMRPYPYIKEEITQIIRNDKLKQLC